MSAELAGVNERSGRGALAQAAVAGLVLAILFAGYLAAMRATVDVSAVTSDQDADTRDRVYLLVHGGMLGLSAISGFATGKWLGGSGLGYAVLFVLVMAFGMVGLQLVTFELACHGHNGLIRHWHC
ncbi:hypothetical protein [Tepidiforma sp.]|uniref:hypothetical protein n=1 Tax=Tepidiforma sp. TaxID=2682230 RepID=UPI002ADD646D|nr:hypothetical protein [Tepidiforma sp.]